MNLTPIPADERDPPEVKVRLQDIHVVAVRRTEEINARLKPRLPEINARLSAIQTEQRPLREKIVALWQLADDLAKDYQGSVACRRGCAHCCHIGVAVFEAEARVIGQRIGRPPADAPGRLNFEDFDSGYHNPCTFLRGSECSIYEHRPLACRAHYSIDVDDLLCRLDLRKSMGMPLLNVCEKLSLVLVFEVTRRIGKASLRVIRRGGPAALKLAPKFDDIRAWFPR